MKKLALTTLVTLGLSSLASAQGIDPKTTSEIANQINITQNTSALLLQKLNTQNTGTNVNLSDYKKFKNDFRNKVEQALISYELSLKNDVLKRVSILMDRYNSIYNSKDYSDQQKQNVLPQQFTLIQNQMVEISTLYQKYLTEIFKAAGKIPLNSTYSFIKNPSSKCHFSREVRKSYDRHGYELGLMGYSNQNLDGSNGSTEICTVFFFEWNTYGGTSRFGFYGSPGSELQTDQPMLEEGAHVGTRLFQRETYPYLKSFCQSQLCLSFVASDITLFLTLVSTELDKDLEFKLADGRTLELKAKKLLYAVNSRYQTYFNSDSLPFAQLRLTSYPKEDFESMPYDTAN